MQFESELCGLYRGEQLFTLLCIRNFVFQGEKPVLHQLRNPIPHHSRPAVELRRRRKEETPARKHALLHVPRAVSTAASCRSSFDPKCAKIPLLLILISSASRPIDTSSSPSAEAMSTAARRISRRMLSAPALL